MKLYRDDNTEGYTTSQIDAFNTEWKARAEELNLEEYTENYETHANNFCDEIARR